MLCNKPNQIKARGLRAVCIQLQAPSGNGSWSVKIRLAEEQSGSPTSLDSI